MASNAGTWKCSKCAFENSMDRKSCEICNDLEEDGTSQGYQSFSTWSCAQCTYDNNATVDRCEMCYCPRNEDQEPVGDTLENETRIILVGRTGSGKSATGNTILNRDFFKSESSCSSVTVQCNEGQTVRFNRKIQVVDTPGIFDTAKDNDTVTREILRCTGLAAPGPHAILLVVGLGRFTEEERETVALLQKAFGRQMINYLIIVFTRQDDLERSGKDLKELIKNAPSALRKVVADCNNRYVALNNNGDEAEKEDQVLELFKLIDDVISENGGGFYTSTIFEKTEYVIQQREEEIKEQNRMDYRRQLSDIERETSRDYEEKVTPIKMEKNHYVQELSLLRQHRKELSKGDSRTDCLYSREKGDSRTDCLYSREGQHRNTSCVEENADILVEQKVRELESKLVQLQRQQKVIKRSTELTLEQREMELRCKIREMNAQARSHVRKEIERGDSNILRRFWGKITEAGHEIIEKFRSIFDTLKQKFANM